MKKLLTDLYDSLDVARGVCRLHGSRALIEFLFYGTLRRLFNCRSFQELRLDQNTVTTKVADTRFGMASRRATVRDLAKVASDPDMDLQAGFAGAAVDSGDSCYIIEHDGKAISYLWCSTRRTALYPGVVVKVHPGWVYYYKGFTAAAHRGQRLIGILNVHVLQEVLQSGRNGLVCLVEATNFASQRACRQIGYRAGSRFHVVRFWGATFVWRTGRRDRVCLTLEKSSV